MQSPKRLARTAGILYLFVGIFGGFSEGFVDPRMYVAGNATATAANVVAHAGLVRLGVVAHLLDGTFFVFLALTLYVLLQQTQKSVARAMLVLVALATGIICLNAVFQFEALRVATDRGYAAAFGAAGSNALVLLLLDTQHYGTRIAQVFFGLSTCWPRSCSPPSARRFTPSSSSRRPSPRSRWSSTCSSSA